MRTPATRVRRLFVLMLVLAGSVNALLVHAFTNGAGLSHAKSHHNSTPYQTRLKLGEALGRAPLSFEANEGQTGDARVKFLSRGDGYDLFLTSTEATFAFFKTDKWGDGPSNKENPRYLREPIHSQARSDNKQAAVLRMSLADADRAVKVKGVEELSGKSNYFIGHDSKKWRTNVPTYSRVKYESIYPGVDLVFYGKGEQLEYDFIIAARANPEAIRLRFEGAERIELDTAGDLVIGTRAGEIRQRKPLAYQEHNGARREVPCSYVIRDKREVAFRLSTYDARKPFTIDPVLSYATYFGGNTGQDTINGIAIDSAGNAYITGATSAVDFPTTPGAFQNQRKAIRSAFVTKLNPTGTAIVYSTYLGGSSFEEGSSIAVDPGGNAYITGDTTSIDFPTTPNAYKPRFRGGFSDAFVTKLNATGTALIYSTYLGGRSGQDYATGIALDSEGNAYITGYTQSVDFPTTPGAAQVELHGYDDAFVTKVNAEGSALAYSTYLGGDSFEMGRGIAVDSSGNAYVAGNTASSNFPTRNAFQPVLKGFANAFVAKLNGSGERFVYSTYLGIEFEHVAGIAVDTGGNAWVLGNTMSKKFPTTPGAFQTAPGGSDDFFLAKLNDNGSELIYSTYIGGSGPETVGGVALDSAGNIYVTGGTNSFDFPLANPLQNRKLGSVLFKSTDAGANWSDVPLNFVSVNQIVFDLQTPSTLYASSSSGVIKSTDRGNSWKETGLPFASFIAVDPLSTSTIYGVAGLRVYKSRDGGASSSLAEISSGNTDDIPTGLVIDPKSTSTLYVSTLAPPIGVPVPAESFAVPARSSVFKSIDGGGTWFPLDLNVPRPGANSIAIDPQTPSTLYVALGSEIHKTIDGGLTWSLLSRDFFVHRLVIDPTNPSIIYAPSASRLYKTTDGGKTWLLTPEPNSFIRELTISPQTPTTLYASTFDGILKSTDGGNHWSISLKNIIGGAVAIDPEDESTLYLGTGSTCDAFVIKLNASASAIVYSTYLGGFSNDFGRSIAVDPFGNAYVAGATSSDNLPVSPNAFQRRVAGPFTGFVARIADPKRPKVVDVSVKGKKLFVTGESFGKGAVILINNEEQKTQSDDILQSTVLISKKAGKKIAPGQTVVIRVRNLDGSLSEAFSFTRHPE